MTDSMAVPNIILRAMEPEDLDFLYRIENDPSLWDVGATNVPYSRFALQGFIATSTGDIYADKQVRMMIDDEAHRTVGIVDLVNFDPQHSRAEVGIVVEKPARRQHFALVALGELHRYAHNVLHVHQLYAIIAEGNTAARQLFSAMGYVESGMLKHWLYNGRNFEDACLMQKEL